MPAQTACQSDRRVERSETWHRITDANATGGFRQKWRLDQLGNWSDFQEDANGDNDFSDAGDLDQDRTHNDANEISGISETGGQAAWVDPVYDLAGNMTEGPAPGGAGGAGGTTNLKFIYDAWNRLVEVTDNSDVTIATFEYDGLNRRIAKTDELADPDVDYDYYYDESWRVLEVRKDADVDPLHQYVWQPPGVYIDALAIAYYDANTDNAGIEELYATFDANMNVTALVNSSGTVVERYEYDAYGQPSVLDADFSADGDGISDYENEVLFGGYRYDPESGLYHVRNRMYHPCLGRWMQRDPAGYADGMSVYELTRSNPMLYLDPTGLLLWDLIKALFDNFVWDLNNTVDALANWSSKITDCLEILFRLRVNPVGELACCANTIDAVIDALGGLKLNLVALGPALIASLIGAIDAGISHFRTLPISDQIRLVRDFIEWMKTTVLGPVLGYAAGVLAKIPAWVGPFLGMCNALKTCADIGAMITLVKNANDEIAALLQVLQSGLEGMTGTEFPDFYRFGVPSRRPVVPGKRQAPGQGIIAAPNWRVG